LRPLIPGQDTEEDSAKVPTATDGHSSAEIYASSDFEEAAEEMFDMLHGLAVALLHVLATGLGLQQSAARDLCDTTTPGPTEFSASVLRLYRYFGGARPEAACGVHADIGLLTLSPRADMPGLTVLDGTEHSWVDAEDGVDAKVCSVFAGECLGPWSNGRFQAPLHYVNEQSQAAAERATQSTATSLPEPVRHSWPFFFRSPSHAILSPPRPPSPAAVADGGSEGVCSAEIFAGGKPMGTADFVESEVFGRRAWRRPKDSDGERPEY
jgi:isopenicillin N synthase-like dioxygenase